MSTLNLVERVVRHPVALALGAGLLVAALTLQLLQHKAETDGRAELVAALVTLKANLSVETIRSKNMGVAAMIGLNEPVLKQAALGKYPLDAPEVLERLSIPRKQFGFEGTYVVDQDGLMVANDTDGKKSTGKSIPFRPYFQQAIRGQESIYAAVGAYSDSRGIYYAAPLYEGSSKGKIIGVISIKTSADPLDDVLRQAGGNGLLLSPQGVVFASTKPEWLLSMSPPFSEKRVEDIRKLKQFGQRFDNKTPTVLGFDPYAPDFSIDGVRYVAERIPLDWRDPAGNWTLVRFHDASKWFPKSLKLSVLGGILLLALASGLTVQYLLAYRRRIKERLAAESVERQNAEKAVVESAKRGEALAETGARLRDAVSIGDLSQCYLSSLAAMLEVRYGLFYVADEAKRELVLVGGYGVADGDYGRAVAYGEGLTGQCAIERVPVQLDQPPAGYLRIASGTGEGQPSWILLRPLLLNEQLVAVVELAGFRPIDRKDMEVLQELEPVVAACVEIITRKQQYNAEFSRQLGLQQALLDSIPNPIFYKGVDARFIGCNAAYEKAFNVRKADFIGKRVLDLECLPMEERLAYQREDEAVIDSVGSVRREVQLTYADGKIHRCVYWVQGFRLPDGPKGGLVGTFIDIEGSSRRKAGRYMPMWHDDLLRRRKRWIRSTLPTNRQCWWWTTRRITCR
ncbi:MAG: GAF domain-containing protein [Gallionella sp.]|jgi:PAS domain-containing protein|nr:GAF domain-containing protein [Gallionella sp.]MCK9353077.1 GAF domain-containing protein [Gallionella sp.]